MFLRCLPFLSPLLPLLDILAPTALLPLGALHNRVPRQFVLLSSLPQSTGHPYFKYSDKSGAAGWASAGPDGFIRPFSSSFPLVLHLPLWYLLILSGLAGGGCVGALPPVPLPLLLALLM